MNVFGLLSLFDQLPAYKELVADLQQPGRRVPPLGLLRSARAALLAALTRDLERPLLIVVGQVDRARELVESLRAWSPTSERVMRLPEPLPHFYERAPWNREAISGRLRVLTALSDVGAGLAPAPLAPALPVVVASALASMQPTLPRRHFRLGTRSLEPGQLLDLERTLATWIGLGYRPAPVVEAPGEFSRRGGILDIFPPAAAAPIRIELFGDEIESLRHFDPATQRSQDRAERALITPASEALPRFGPRVAEQLAAWDLSALPEDDATLFLRDREALATGSAFSGIEFYLPLLYSHPATLPDYFPPEGLVILEDEEELASAWAELESHALDLRQSAEKAGLLPPDFPRPYVSWDDWKQAIADRAMLELGYGVTEEESPESESSLARAFTPGPRFGGQLKPLVGHIRAAVRAGEQVVVVSRQARRLAELWAQEDSFITPLPALTDPPEGRLTFVHAALAEGWSVKAPRAGGQVTHLLTDAEIFGWARPRPRRRRPRKVAPETFFADMTPGDFAVHMEHGIGIFRGLTTLQLEDTEREYLLIQYEGQDKLYVPIHQADRLSRYVGADDRPPRLNRLGGAEWARVREHAQRAVEEVAEELLELYATRATIVGHAFSPDAPWQAELEAAFPYIETEDQLQAIEEVKVDMERSRPMDRLICGDVGYGKTEVALRAAFKAVMDGKQVAILVPTTVLAQQHYNTFRERLQPFPVEVEMLSRFRSRQEQTGVLDQLTTGQVDVVIGTHRLLSRDVAFKDLGLLVIDEEQRFGVIHKERLKQLRTEMDVLTMTATPIPRTLHLSLAGARDISIIDTPPEERLPVRTHVGQYDDKLVRRAILREIDRGGQVFFVHNRVMGIEQVQRRLAQLVPEATLAVAHGQMHERMLEGVMLRFVGGKIDVLISTNIIESGLDIPNANTLIVNQADRFGLAQLYQLRGRVGRGAQRAYAYFFYDNPRRLTEDARRRLETIHEASELGAGFTIAMRDLEIRGSGDILGTRQHGHISAVGFDLYTRLLAQAVQEKKAQETGEPLVSALPSLVTIDLPLPAYIPSEYVPDTTLRLRLYRRLAQLTTLDEIDAIAEEMADRFGPIPDEVDNLLYQLRLKVLAGAAGVEAIAVEAGKLAIRCSRLEKANRPGLQRRLGRGVRVSRRAVWVPYADIPQQTWRVLLVQALEALSEL
jgi:transcription-repair coupling factor (superfamily II helicase)